jgi:hypothetical protein
MKITLVTGIKASALICQVERDTDAMKATDDTVVARFLELSTIEVSHILEVCNPKEKTSRKTHLGAYAIQS